MKKFSALYFLLCFAISALAQSNEITNLSESYALFAKKVSDGKMTFVKPEGAVEISVIKNSIMHYEYAIRLKDKNIEIRYSVWPLTKDFFDVYDQREKSPGDSIYNPNKLHNRIPAIAYSKISEGMLTPEQIVLKNFSSTTVKNDFGADAGSMFIGPVGSAFGQKYTWGMFTMLHKDNAADAYIFYLFENKTELIQWFKDISNAYTKALTFK